LRKDREERYQAIHDLLVDLRELKREADLAAGLERSTPPASRSVEIPTQIYDSSAVSAQTGVLPPASTTPIAHHPTSSAEYVAGEIKKNKKAVIAVAVIVLVVGLAVLGI